MMTQTQRKGGGGSRRYKRQGGKTRKQRRRKQNKTRRFKIWNCSPAGKLNPNRAFRNTCYTSRELRALRDKYNQKKKERELSTSSSSSSSLIEEEDPREIWDALRKQLGEKCSNEACWSKELGLWSAPADAAMKNNVSNEEGGGGGSSTTLVADKFAPEHPKSWHKNPNEWLSSNDILRVMKQYEEKYPEFDFLGPSPIDFDAKDTQQTQNNQTQNQNQNHKCVWDELCHLDISQMRERGKTKLGIIFNLDPHDKGGSHWVSMFIDLTQQFMFYYDSAGDPAPKEVQTLVQRLQTQDPSLRFHQNAPLEHQQGNTECGMYALYFLAHMVEGTLTPEELMSRPLPDEYIQQFRHIYFNS